MISIHHDLAIHTSRFLAEVCFSLSPKQQLHLWWQIDHLSTDIGHSTSLYEVQWTMTTRRLIVDDYEIEERPRQAVPLPFDEPATVVAFVGSWDSRDCGT